MWTYLAIFLSFSVIASVFGRRVILYLNVKKQPEQKSSIFDDVEKLDEEDKVDVSRSEKDEVATLVKQAESFIEIGNEDDAIKSFVKALSINPHDHDAQERLAILYMNKQMFGAASALYKKLAQETQDPIHFSHLGFSLFKQNLFEEAKEAYQAAISIDPLRPQRFVSLCQVYRAAGNFNNAVIALKKAIELDDNNEDYKLLLVDLYKDLKDFENAKIILENIIRENPEHDLAMSMINELKS